MKTMLPSLSLLLLASSMTIFPEAEASGKPVLDVKGFEILLHVLYYLNAGPIGGGVVILGDRNDSCPVDVVLHEQLVGGGYIVGNPVTFKIASGQPGFFITDYTEVFISFNATSNCTDHDLSMVWKHEKDSDGFTEFLNIGGVKGRSNTIFRIVQDGSFGFFPKYKLAAYTLSSSSGLYLFVSDVGVSYDFNSEIRRLALTEPPLTFGIVLADYKSLLSGGYLFHNGRQAFILFLVGSLIFWSFA